MIRDILSGALPDGTEWSIACDERGDELMTTISLTKQGKTVKSGFGGAPTSRGLDYAAWTGKRTDFPRIVAVRALPQVDRFEIKLASRRTIALEFGPVERTLNLKFGLTSIPENEEVAEFVVDVRDANIRGRSQRPNGGGSGPAGWRPLFFRADDT